MKILKIPILYRYKRLKAENRELRSKIVYLEETIIKITAQLRLHELSERASKKIGN